MSLNVSGLSKPNKAPKISDLTVGKRTVEIPEGRYRARITEIQDHQYFSNKKRSFEFYFEIAEGEHQGVVLRGFMNAHYETFTPFTKLYKWYVIASGYEPDEGETLDLNVFFETKVDKGTEPFYSFIYGHA